MSLVERAKARFPARPHVADEGWREFVTPEGVDLKLQVATYGERCSAFLLDLIFLLGAMTVFTVVALLAGWATRTSLGREGAFVAWTLGVFLLRNFYFIWFEMRPGAATPGKRRMGLRVVARDGGRLTADAVFARNAMRELEIFLPLSFLFARGQGIDGVLIGLGAIWSGVFVVFPLFNRDRLRLGDLAAGTMVVRAPKRMLRPDLAAAAGAPAITFTQAQLDAYGVKELHVLESVLRRRDRKTLAEVARRIRAKIGWEGHEDLGDAAFLGLYYAALRGRLESRMLFGHRRRDKFDTA